MVPEPVERPLEELDGFLGTHVDAGIEQLGGETRRFVSLGVDRDDERRRAG